MVVGEQDYYYSSSDSDDEDVSRYVFLARQPVPVGRHHPEEDDRDASFANDDDDGGGGDGTAGEEESEGGVCKRKKRPVLEKILDDDAPPPTKKVQVELIIASPLATQTPPSGSESSNLASPPLAGESGSEESHEKAHEHRPPREQGRAKNATKKQRGACGKRGRSSGCDVDGDRDAHRRAVAVAGKTGASSGATSGRLTFTCSLCDRCFDSHQALGGHVLGHHRKRAKIAIAAGAVHDVVDDKVHGKGKGGVGEPVFAGSHDIAVSSGHGFTYGNSRSDKKMDIGTASPNRKIVVAGTCREGANGNGNGNGDGCRTRYKCKVCGTECLTGRALGGHMGKHQKRLPVGGGGKADRSPSPATRTTTARPLAQLFGAETRLQREIGPS